MTPVAGIYWIAVAGVKGMAEQPDDGASQARHVAVMGDRCSCSAMRGAEYPAEHNVGHLYFAKQALRDHYKALDPSNSFNPGIGHTSKCSHWK